MRTLAAVVVLVAVLPSVSWSHYTNEWAVEVSGGKEAADVVASDLGCVNHGAILEDVYLFSHPHVSKRSVLESGSAHEDISAHPEVRWAEQQRVLSRKKRQFWRLQQPEQEVQQYYEDLAHFNDARWPQMWYLNRGNRMDMNVQQAWLEGATGKGVSVTILDDGIEKNHPDLIANYDPLASFDVNQNDNDPTPRYDLIDSNRHGTRCAGEVAASGNNSECAVGIAFEAGIGGVRMLDGDVTDAVEARSIGLNNQHIDIYSASWGPDDDGKTVDGPGTLATRAFLQGITSGRGGKGSIFVWASGNGGRDHDNCNCDGYTNAVWTLSVSSATENGLIPWYSEACSSTLASTYSSGSSGERKVVTTDLHYSCTSTHTGTSASAPLAAGIIALALQVNPQLTWRDVQHLTVRCAHVANLKAPDWAVNAMGRNYSHSFGYGIMDATCMTRLARTWHPVSEQKKCSRKAEHLDLIIPGKSSNKAVIEVKDCDEVRFLEHVQAHVTLSASKRGDVLIYLTSPSGTRSNLVAKRPKDYSRAGFNDWPFLTVHMWEESPIGTWTLEVQNDGRSIVELKEFSLNLLGTSEPAQASAPTLPLPPQQPASPPIVKEQPKPEAPVDQVANVDVSVSISPSDNVAVPKLEHCMEVGKDGHCDVCVAGFLMLDGKCLDKCPEFGYFKGTASRQDACIACYYSCKTCSGPNDYQCTSCFGDAELEQESPSQRYCYNKSLIDRVFSSSRWYYVLSIGFLVNLFIVVILVVYILRWRNSKDRGASILPRVGPGANGSPSRRFSLPARKYSVVKQLTDHTLLPKSGSSLPFRDYDSTSEEEELFRSEDLGKKEPVSMFPKPYTDEEPK